MTRLLVLAGIASLLTACAIPGGMSAAKIEQPTDEAAVVAAALGYHGPVDRVQRKRD